MILGMTPFLSLHVLISLVAIFTGLIVLYGLLTNQPLKAWTHTFVITTIATSLTGLGLPYDHITPAVAFSILSLIILTFTVLGLYVKHLAGAWRWIYIVSAVIALYLNVFVLIVQSFLKIPALHALAPQGNEPPFAIAQGITLVFFAITGFLAVKRFHPVAGAK
jgi:hypothetical protein